MAVSVDPQTQTQLCHILITAAPSSEFVSSRFPSWQILTAHAQPLRGARDLAFCLKVPFDSLLVWASSGGSGETARLRRLAWTFPARIGDKYQIRLTRPKLSVPDQYGLFNDELSIMHQSFISIACPPPPRPHPPAENSGDHSQPW